MGKIIIALIIDEEELQRIMNEDATIDDRSIVDMTAEEVAAIMMEDWSDDYQPEVRVWKKSAHLVYDMLPAMENQ